MKIVYLIAGTYRPAGMERVLANKANWLSAHGCEVTIVTTDQRGRRPAFRLSESIAQMDLGINYEKNNGRSFLNKILSYPWKHRRHKRRLRRVLKRIRPDITVSMFCNDASFVPKIKDGSVKVLEAHFCRFKRIQYGRKGIWALADRFMNRMDERTARRFDRFVVLTEEDRGYWNVPGVMVIPNFPTFTYDKPTGLDEQVVLAVGRYCYQKHFCSLIEAWNMIKTKVRKGWKLRIVGEGYEREKMEEIIDMFHLGSSVILGSEYHMGEVYESASILALSSRYEGLPMAILEAQAAGVPVVSYDCKCGPKDLIEHGVNGFLAPEDEPDEMARYLEVLMSDDELRHRMGEEAFRSSERYNRREIMYRWLALFEELCQKRAKR